MQQELQDKIKKRRTQMLIHSCIYYVLDESIVADHVWQEWANELRDLQEKHGCKIDYYDEEFADWDGSSGSHLPIRGPWVLEKAQQLLKYTSRGG